VCEEEEDTHVCMRRRREEDTCVCMRRRRIHV
jgi:hypothetical protein